MNAVSDKLNDWVSSADDRLKLIISLAKTQYNYDLDFTPESLKLIQLILLDKFEKYVEVYDLKHSALMDSISTYIGEVYIKNVDTDYHWTPLALKIYDDEFSFTYGIESSDSTIPLNPFINVIPVTVKKRVEGQIYDQFKGNQAYYENLNKEKAQKDEAPVDKAPVSKGTYYQHFILLDKEKSDFNRIVKTLENYFKKDANQSSLKLYNGDYLVITLKNTYNFHLELNSGEGVLDESKEIASDYKGKKDKKDIASKKSRIEFWGDSDADGDYLNEYMYILDELTDDFPLIFNLSSGEFYDEL